MKILSKEYERVKDALPQDLIDKAFWGLMAFHEITTESEYRSHALVAVKSISRSTARDVQVIAVLRGDLELALATAERLKRPLSKQKLARMLAISVKRKDDKTIIAAATLLYMP